MTLSGRGARFLVGALAVSLLLNFVAVGYFGVLAGGALAGSTFLRNMATPFPEPLRRAFRADLFAHRGELLAALGDLRAARDRLHGALIAPTLEQAAVAEARVGVRDAATRLLDLLQDALIRSVATLPDDVRRTLPTLNVGMELFRQMLSPDPGSDPGG